MRRSEIRDHILDTAFTLFNEHGFAATGVDLIVARSGVAKTTLYRHFPTKEELIVATITRQDERVRDSMRAFVKAHAKSPGDAIPATFDWLAQWFADDGFRGCLFLAAAAEHTDIKNSIFHAAQMHKRLTLAYLEELAHAAGYTDAKRIAAEIAMLHEGATAVAQFNRDPATALSAKAAALRLLAAEPVAAG
ncbi:TetR/AcrR family transcriptional regulator [Acuticoccus kandeliae]|uniref:TetR/AcrR family transcriptional regulator n=1 Tax=Acuticoccus kandeliae TaxID=2073160 RepID=UPI000D3E8555|nr:TetR/AcrR family transcriptional regulator [Acuticoccus kandeliae]